MAIACGRGTSHPLVLVQAGRKREEGEIDRRQARQHPVEVLQVSAVDVGAQPAQVGAAFGVLVDGGDEEAGDEVAHGDCGHEEAAAHCAHGVRHLLVEEVHLAGGEQHFGHAQQHDLGEQPEGAHGKRRERRVQQAFPGGHALAPVLHQSCADHGQDGDAQP